MGLIQVISTGGYWPRVGAYMIGSGRRICLMSARSVTHRTAVKVGAVGYTILLIVVVV